MSLINREDLLQTLGITDMDCEKCGWYSRTARRCKRGSDFEDACCAIDDAPEVKSEPHWIPVSERLPENKTAYYLVTLGNFGDFYVYHEDIDIARWDYDHRKGKDSWHWCKERTVTAWMPLPESYREEGENR